MKFPTREKRMLLAGVAANVLFSGAFAAETQPKAVAQAPALRLGPTLAAAAASPTKAGEPAPEQAEISPRQLGLSADDVRPDEQLTLDLFGRPLVIGGEIEGGLQSQSNFDLDNSSDDFRLRAQPEAKLEAFYQLADNIAFFAQAKAFIESEVIDRDGSNATDEGLRLDQAWGAWSNEVGGTKVALQVGRQQFQDRREWWWDDVLEAVRLHFARGRVSGFLAIAEKLWSASTLEPLDPEDRDVRRIMANVAYAFDPRKQVDFYFLKQNDRSGGYAPLAAIAEDVFDEADADLIWFGARYRGRHKIGGLGKVHLSLDGAMVRGDEVAFDADEAGGIVTVVGPVDQRVRGAAFDGALSWEVPIEFEPVLSVGYAWGSGDRDPDDARDGAFRQTGLHGNNGKFRGISRFRYYGEVLRPDLSNLRILTASVGAPVVRDQVWVEAVFHRYRQGTARDEISGSRLDLDPTGLSRKLGREVNLVVSYEHPNRHWEAELSGGAFKAGEAFGVEAGEWATGVALKINYNF